MTSFRTKPTTDETSFRLAFFVPTLAGGGAERVMVTLANTFADTFESGRENFRINVDLIACNADGPFRADVSPNVRVLDLARHGVLAALPRLTSYFTREKPDAMVSAMSHANLAALIAKKLSGSATRIVISEHNTLSMTSRRSVKLATELILMRALYHQAGALVAVSKGVAKDLMHELGTSAPIVRTIYNPIEIDRVHSMSLTRLDHPIFAEPEWPVIIGVGRLTHQKNFPLLLAAFAKVRAQRQCRLIILGEGPLRAELETLVLKSGLMNDVLLPGFEPNPFAWMANSKVFVLSSDFEGLPTVLIEALATGVAVISTDCPSGPSEILDGGRLGRLVTTGSVEEMAKAIHNALSSPSAPTPLYELERYTPKRIAADYWNVIMEKNLD
jgi:glycosyltransferase involved in cell wall biosynthesis